MIKKSLILIMFFLVISGMMFPQIKKAQVGFRFLENPVSAEVMGRGGVGVTTTFNSNGLFWNPALIAWIDKGIDISINHTSGIADINYNSGAAAVQLGDFGVLGLSLLAMDYGTFFETRRGPGNVGYVELGTFSPTAFAAGLGFAQKISERFSYGVQVKYVYQNLGDAWVASKDSVLSRRAYTSTDLNSLPLAVDLGAFYDFLYNGIRFGASLSNISREFRYETKEFPMPFAISFSATVAPLDFFMNHNPEHGFLLSFESRHPRDYDEKVKFGAEYNYNNMFIARAGYQMNYDERGLTVGAGIRNELSGIPLRIDYAYEPFGIFGGVHFLSLGVSY